MAKQTIPYDIYEALFQRRASHTGLDHLRWLYHRLVNVHEEDENVDYMLTFKDIIRELEAAEDIFGIHPRKHVIPDTPIEQNTSDIFRKDV